MEIGLFEEAICIVKTHQRESQREGQRESHTPCCTVKSHFIHYTIKRKSPTYFTLNI